MVHSEFTGLPFIRQNLRLNKVDRILVNAVGFVDNAVRILLRR
ncbi:MAG TPA: hypothetical protein VKN36_00740 [Eudoraea sp.]|nr:hypothetical protein [Eudoraea sp.]